jgi:hypothetical protein
MLTSDQAEVGWPATDRYDLPHAPGTLGFVQDVLNTQPTQHPPMPDLLADLVSAQQWLDGALAFWSSQTGVPQTRVVLTDDDLGRLRDLRADLTALINSTDRGRGAPLFSSASLAARVGSDNDVLLEPRGEGSRRVTSVVLIEAFTAQQIDNWRRLKVCRNDRCGVSFYDRSRNNSGVWHDARVCGNAINLRASRARKRDRQLAQHAGNTAQNS